VTLRTELEVLLGGIELRAIQRTVGAVAGLSSARTSDAEPIAYLARRGRRGLPLCALHGFGGDKETWLLMSALVPRARGIVLVDLPGHGRSAELAETPATIRHHAEGVLRALDHANVERAIVCGNSMGGGVALRLAAPWPSRVAGLVLVASVGRDVHDGGARAWADGPNPLIPREEDIETFMDLVIERPLPVPRAVIRHVATQRARRGDALTRLFRAFIQGGGEAGVPRDLAAITQPALVLHGEQDRIIDVRTAKDLAVALPDATLQIMRGVGHAPQLEAPRTTARMIEAFARRVDAGRPPRA
jgi:pyruvate dehydrogenase E2 component (dihydrolipoamide acetyltransferase)